MKEADSPWDVSPSETKVERLCERESEKWLAPT